MTASRLRDRLAAQLAPRRLLPALAAGLVIGAVAVIVAISFAALVFAGPLEAFTGTAVGLALVGAAVLAIAVAAASSFPGMVATPQDSTAAIVALIVAAVVGGLDASAAPRTVLLTAVATVALVTVLTGGFFFLLGRFRLGGLVRYLPYPVIGGFLAGTGWLLLRGAIGVMAEVPLGFATLGALATPEVAVRWVPGAVFAVALMVVLRRTDHALALPGMLLGAIAVFYGALALTGTSIAEARRLGLLLGPFPEGALFTWLTPSVVAGADWGAVLARLGGAAPVLVVGVVAMLLNATGLELAVRRDVDLDRELRVAGVANLVAGGLGGLPGFQTLSLSALGHRLAPDSRLVGLVAGLLAAGTALFGGALLAFLPKAALGGLLLFLGLAFLVEWVVDARTTLPRPDYLVVLVILLLIATVGFLESVGAGIVFAVVLFVVNYSRVDVVRYVLDGESHRSHLDRPREQLELLRQRGGSLMILRLQGYLFFGTANGLLDRLRRRLDDPARPRLARVLIDFAMVSGIDSSAVLSFVKLRQLAEARGLGVVVTELGPRLEEQLRRGGFLDGEPGIVRAFPELDRGLEWCEDEILIAAGAPAEPQAVPIRERLERALRGTVDVERVLAHFERREHPAGEFLMHCGGAPDDGLFVVESGRVTAQLPTDSGRVQRLQTMGPGSICGELELYLGIPRAADVVAETGCVVWWISAAALRALQEVEPAMASRFHALMCRNLADRLAKNNALLRTLLA